MGLESETVKTLVAQSCPTLCDPMDSSPPGSSVHRILQARILEWVAISFSRGSSWPKDQTQVSYSGRQILYRWVTWEVDFWILWGKFNNFQLSDTDKYYEARDSGGLRKNLVESPREVPYAVDPSYWLLVSQVTQLVKKNLSVNAGDARDVG